ncbi:MAG: hypothetical protein B7X93_03030 [Hydrogenophilales bacterium 17-61-9]|nr:MAG: hypothetical protein B7X93_03030 [Hydrogenophilales bacterium 17-61-9]
MCKMMKQNLLVRNTSLLSGGVMAASGGWLALNSSVLNGFGYALLAMAGAAMLLLAWRIGARDRFTAWAVFFAWCLGAGTALPSGWLAFFGDNWGWAGWVVWAAVAASPALIFPARLTPLALSGGAVISSLTPIGMMNPIVAAMAFFPGMSWAGLLLSIALLTLPSITNKKLFALSLVAALTVGAALGLRNGLQLPPETAWAVETREGAHPKLAVEWFARQARMTARVKDGVEQGARLVVTPEGAVDSWDAWSEFVWKDAAALAEDHRAMILVGVYRHEAGNRIWQDGLMDPVTGEFYGAAVPMPISMWKPWNEKEHYPFDFTQIARTIKTPVGEAAYLICFEELLVWPLVARMVTGEPEFLISASNQWFTNASTAEAQERSVKLQARMWGLPLLRSVNWPR